MGLLIKMFKAWSTQGSYFCASFCCVSPCLYSFVFCFLEQMCVCVRNERCLRVCVRSGRTVCTRRGTVWTLILDFSFTRVQLITAQNSGPGISCCTNENTSVWMQGQPQCCRAARTHTDTLHRHPFAMTIIIAWKQWSPTLFQRDCVCSQSHSNPYSLS